MRKLLVALVTFGLTAAATIAAAGPATAAPGSADVAPVVLVPTGLHARTVPYIVGVNNLGPDTATSVTITVRLPRQVVSAATAPQCTYNRRTDVATCTFEGVPGESAVLVPLDARVGVLSFGVHLTATAIRTASSPPDPNPANDTATVTCRANVSLLILC